MKNWIKNNWAVLLIVLVAVLIMTPKLERPAMWQDEAETALLARSIIQDGVPMAWDGTNLITQLSGNDSNAEYVWSFTPWLPFYIVAGSFSILGETNFAGRIPYVIIGIAALFALYFFALRYARNRTAAVLASIIMFLNMQFILYSRQCKYYAILFLVPPLLYMFYRKIHRRISSFILFVLMIAVLFYTNFVSLFTAMIGIIIYTFAASRRPRHIGYLVLAGVLSLFITIPFFTIGDFGASSSLISKMPSFAEYFDKLARHIWYFNNMVFGLLLFIPLGIFYAKKYFSIREKKTINFILFIVFSAWLTLPFFNQDVFRYNLHLIPLFSVLTSLLVIAFFRWSRVAGIVFLLLILTTNIFSNFPFVVAQAGLKLSGVKFAEKSDWFSQKFKKDPEKTRKYFEKFDREMSGLTFAKILTHDVLKSEYAAYYNELTTDYPDAMADLVEFFRKNGSPGDSIYSNFDMLPVVFYLPYLRAAYVVDPSKLIHPKEPPLPEYITSLKEVSWYFFRDVKMNLGLFMTDEEFKAELENRGGKLVPHSLSVSSLYWDVSWPQRYKDYLNKMLWHDTEGYENVIVYKKE